jgi:hypothetical protein
MIFWLAIFAGGMFAWIGVRTGFFATWIMFFHLVLAACVSIFLTPWVVAGVPAATSVYGYGYALTLMSIAVATLFIAYGTCYACLSGRLEMAFPRFFDTIVAGLLGFLSGFLVSSFLVLVFFLMPVSQLDFFKRLGFDTSAQETNTSFICWWCDGLHWFISPLCDESTSLQAIDLLMAKASPPTVKEPPPPPPPPPETAATTASSDVGQGLGKTPESAAGNNAQHDDHPKIVTQPEILAPPVEKSSASLEGETPKPSVSENRPKNSLSGTWMAIDGTQFSINDTGKAIAIDLVSSDAIQSVKGKLIRRDNQSFTGTLNIVFSADLTRRYSVDVSLTITDPQHLHLRSTNWPSWDNAGKYQGKVVLEEDWTQGKVNYVNPFDP